MRTNRAGRSCYNKMLSRMGVALAATALCCGMLAGAALADDDNSTSDEAAALSQSQGILNSDYKISKKELKSTSDLPSALDLRHYNGTVSYDSAKKQNTITGGINYVTPIKMQNPFQDCWAFSVIAASETSMLTSLDRDDDGEMNGSVDYDKAASGEAGSMALAASNLSERHLAYCVFTQPKTTGAYSDQAGEGRYLVSGNTDGASILNPGGMPLAGVTAFSCGIGPVSESTAPYISDENYVNLPIPVFDITSTDFMKHKLFTSYEDAVNYIGVAWNKDSVNSFKKSIADMFQQPFVPADDEQVATMIKGIKPRVSEKGTWSVDSSHIYESVAELTGSNLLETTSDDGLDDNEIASIKQELSEGCPVSIAFYADQSTPGQVLGGNTYMNTDNWAQYTYTKLRTTHGVTIVGYDDNYDKSNFTHNIYATDKDGKVKTDAEGNPVVDEEATAKTTPAHNGAWIVKNSWGSSDNSEPLYQADWGVDGSGYFYLSYYDVNISNVESFEFDTSEKAQKRTSYATAQYDISKSTSVQSTGTDSEYKMCNVFTDDGDNSGATYKVRDVGCMTGVAGDTVKLDVYLMDDDDDVTAVISKGKPVSSQTKTFEHAGFHRFSLKDGPVIFPGKKAAVVQTTKRPDGQYECTYFFALSKNLAETVNDLIGGPAVTTYTKTVINKGESLEYSGGTWKDWSESSKTVSAQLTSEMLDSQFKESVSAEDLAKAKQQVGAGFAIDNFSIKIYADVVSKADQPVKDATVSKTYKASASGKLGAAKKFSAKLKGVKDNAVVTYAKKSVASYATMAVEVSRSGKVTVAKGLPKGTYSLKSASGAASKYFKVTAAGQVKVKKSAKGKLAAGTYKLKFVTNLASKYFKVSKAGKVTVKKGLAKGAYELKVKCAVAATAGYKAKTVFCTYKVKVA